MGTLTCRAALTLLLTAVLVSCGGGGDGGGSSGGFGGLSSGQSPSSPTVANKAETEKDDPPPAERLSTGSSDSLGGVSALRAQGTDVVSALAQRAASEGPLPFTIVDSSAYGMPRTLAYDAVRGDVYASYPTRGSVGISAIARFHRGDAGWASSTLSIPGLLDIALATDASVLAATDTSGKVHLIDPVTFRVKSSHTSPDGIADQGGNTEVGIAFTNDGKLWMPTGSDYPWHGLGFFDLRTSTFGKSTTVCSNCYYGPYLAVASDGSRLMVAPSASMSPAPEMFYMDTTDGVFRQNPIGLTFFYSQTSLSNNGNRFLMTGHQVYDKAFGSVGTVPFLPQDATMATQLSADGRRLYALSYGISSGASAAPLVRVFDASVEAGTQLTLPLVGSFTLPASPSCRIDQTGCYNPRMRISPDGKNLLILGNEKLLIATIPKAMRGF